VALAAVTVNVDEPPAEIEAGLAEIPTVGAVGARLTLPPQPANSKDNTSAETIQGRDLRISSAFIFFTVLSFLTFWRRCIRRLVDLSATS
jgi:hypothetical protein